MKPIRLAGNWKMNKTRAEVAAFFSGLSELKPRDSARMDLYVPYVHLSLASEWAMKSQSSGGLAIRIGAQNVHAKDLGAYTGEISCLMLTDIGVKSVLIGHSERRQYFAETSALCAEKIASALKHGFDVLYCVGETLTEREAGEMESVLAEQLHALVQTAGPGALTTDAAQVIRTELGGRLHIAYEPVWAIGTGKTASPLQAEEAHRFIRGMLGELFSGAQAEKVQILYGGSVTPDNFSDLMRARNINGALVGGASLKPESWSTLWNQIGV